MTKKIPIARPTIRMTSRPTMPSLIETPAKPDAMPVAKGLTVEPSVADPAAEEHDRRAGQGVVAGGDHDRDDQRVKGQALLGHPVASCRRGRRRIIRSGIIHFSRPFIRSTRPRDARLDRAGLHRHAEEPADHQDEQRDVDRAEQRAGVVVADLPLRVLDAVQAVDRRRERVDDDPRGMPRHLVVRPRDRARRRGRGCTCRPG